MFLLQKSTSNLVEVLTVHDLMNPVHTQIVGRYHAGEELQEPEKFHKEDLLFQSGEALPRCWTDANYRN